MPICLVGKVFSIASKESDIALCFVNKFSGKECEDLCGASIPFSAIFGEI